MRERIVLALVLTGLVAYATGCKKQVDHAVLITAINKSFAGRHECVWPQPVKLPAQIDPTTDERIRAFAALTDAGLLLRGSEEKKRALVASKQLNTYNLSDKGTLLLDTRCQPARLWQLLLRSLQRHRHRKSHSQRLRQPHAIHSRLPLRSFRHPRVGSHAHLDESTS